VEVAVAVAAVWNQERHAGVHSGYGILGPRPGRRQKAVAIDAAVATDEFVAGELKVDEEIHGCLAVAVDVVTLCFVVRDELLVHVAVDGLELGSQNGGDMSGSCAVAEVAAVVVVVVVVVVVAAAAAVVVAAAAVVAVAVAAVVDDKGTVEVVGLRLRPHQETCRCDHQQQCHQYLTRLKMYIKKTRI
jgi:hypothetical protein